MNHPNLLLILAILGLILVLGVYSYFEHKRSHTDFMRKLKQFQDDMDAAEKGQEHD